MPEPFVISGIVRRRDGDPAGLLVVAEERGLPSRERRLPDGPVVLGRATTDPEGSFALGFEATRPDLTFTVSGPDGRLLELQEVVTGNHQGRGDDILFNAISPLVVELTVRGDAEPAGGSEYETLLAAIAPELGDLAPGDLTEADLSFLARDLGQDADELLHLAYLRAADLLSRTTNLVAAAFYGWARLAVPDLWSQLPPFDDEQRRDDYLARLLKELTATDPDRLADSLRRAADARIIPPLTGERAHALAQALRGRALTQVSVRLLLVAAASGEPLVGYGVHAYDGTSDLGADVTDALGAVVVSYYSADPSVATSLRLLISDDQTEVTADVLPPDTEVRVPVPTPPDLEALVTAGHFQLTPGTLDILATAGIAGYADIRRRGGVAGLQDLDAGDARTLDALTELDLLTPDPVEASSLLALDYTSVGAIAATPWGRFLAHTADQLPAERAVALRTSAQAQVGMLDLLLAGQAADLANGFSS
ncbi:hypothetical protein OHA70_32400 [Kribbella sp. NBC_00382]|uniref:hypothetical protein n=1 Tax=Kribbella sp. NBC_00382 TaxID=2975967 RepID=UPI002E1CB759